MSLMGRRLVVGGGGVKTLMTKKKNDVIRYSLDTENGMIFWYM